MIAPPPTLVTILSTSAFSTKSCTSDTDRPSFARGVTNLPCKINQRVLDNLIIQTWFI